MNGSERKAPFPRRALTSGLIRLEEALTRQVFSPEDATSWSSWRHTKPVPFVPIESRIQEERRRRVQRRRVFVGTAVVTVGITSGVVAGGLVRLGVISPLGGENQGSAWFNSREADLARQQAEKNKHVLLPSGGSIRIRKGWAHVINFVEHAVIAYDPSLVSNAMDHPLVRAKKMQEEFSFALMERTPKDQQEFQSVTEQTKKQLVLLGYQEGAFPAQTTAASFEKIIQESERFRAKEGFQERALGETYLRELEIELNAIFYGILHFEQMYPGSSYEPTIENQEHEQYHLQLRQSIRQGEILRLFRIYAVNPATDLTENDRRSIRWYLSSESVQVQRQAEERGRTVLYPGQVLWLRGGSILTFWNISKHTVLSYDERALVHLSQAGFLGEDPNDALKFIFVDQKREDLRATRVERLETLIRQSQRIPSSRGTGLELDVLIKNVIASAVREGRKMMNINDFSKEATLELNATLLGVYRYMDRFGYKGYDQSYRGEKPVNVEHARFHEEIRAFLRKNPQAVLLRIEAIDPFLPQLPKG